MRNPNGYGSVVKLSGNRRKPYMARITTGWNDKGHPIYKILGYYEKKKDGIMALAEYNKTPYDIDMSKYTFKEIYEEWFNKEFKDNSSSLKYRFKAAYSFSTSLYDIRYRDLKTYHFQDIVNSCNKSDSSIRSLIKLYRRLDKYCLERDIINKSYADLITMPKVTKISREKIPFTKNEINLLWSNINLEGVDILLILLYSGMRISELLTLRTSQVNMSDKYITGGLKTDSGKDRIIPINNKIIDLIKNRLNNYNDYLITYNNKKISITKYYDLLKNINKTLNMNHTTHECRHTFISELDRLQANKVCVNLIVGHKSNDVGERVYTHKTIEELIETTNLVTY